MLFSNNSCSTSKNLQFSSTWTKYYAISHHHNHSNLLLALSALDNIEIQTKLRLVGNIDCARKCKARAEKKPSNELFLKTVQSKVFYELQQMPRTTLGNPHTSFCRVSPWTPLLCCCGLCHAPPSKLHTLSSLGQDRTAKQFVPLPARVKLCPTRHGWAIFCAVCHSLLSLSSVVCHFLTNSVFDVYKRVRKFFNKSAYVG